MKMLVISVYDKAVEAYARPFVVQSKGQATRSFADEANRPGSEINTHPEDYSLFHIGNFTDNNAELEPIEPVCLARAHEVLAAQD